MSGGRELQIAVLEESQKDLRFELRDIDWSLEEISKGDRPKTERRALVARRQRVKASLERVKRELHELTGV